MYFREGRCMGGGKISETKISCTTQGTLKTPEKCLLPYERKLIFQNALFCKTKQKIGKTRIWTRCTEICIKYRNK